jgi:hypothetical protein
VEDLSHLIMVGSPEDIARGRASPVVGDHEGRDILP